jgi:hypothetical protein
MPKKSKNKSVEAVSQRVYTKRYVHYNDRGEVLSITGIPDDNFKIFEIDIDLIPNFVSYKKDFRKYTIDYFINIAEGLITDEDDQEEIVRNSIVLHDINFKQSSDYDVLIEHDIKNKKWIFSSNAHISKLESVNILPFYVTLKDQHNFLISAYYIDPLKLSKEKFSVDFTSEKELDLNNISLLTIKKFKNYSVISL